MELRFCALDEVGILTAFLDRHWSAGHILTKSRALLDWQFRDESLGRYNFLLAHDDVEGVVGCLGFIPASRYDARLAAADDTIWLTNWKVRSAFATGLGVVLVRSLAKRVPHRWMGTVGLNPEVRMIYQQMGFAAGVLDRYYLVNDDIQDFKLALLPKHYENQGGFGSETAISEFSGSSDDIDLRQVPAKTVDYLRARYLQHPFYDYAVLSMRRQSASAMVVTRLCNHGGAQALRVVDFLGAPEVLAGAGGAFRHLLRSSGAEYLDFYCGGLAEEFAAAGFRRQTAGDGVILPGYFEPFEQVNVDLLYALKGPSGGLVICKGDADQDRPNQMGNS